MSLNEELLEIALEALAKHKISIDDIKSNTSKLDSLLSSSSEAYSADKQALEGKLGSLKTTMLETILSEMGKIPIPEDGMDGLDGSDGESITGPEGKPGRDGESIQGLPGLDGRDGIDGIGLQGKCGLDGKTIKGTDGLDGVGIRDITGNASSISIALTNGQTKLITLPRQRQRSQPTVLPASKRIAGTADAGTLKNLTDFDSSGASNGDVVTYEDGHYIVTTPTVTPGGDGSTTGRVEIEGMFKEAYVTAFKELNYTSGNITQIDVYETNGKLLKLFTKVIGYNGDNNISDTVLTDEVTGNTLTSSISYLDGNIANISTTYA